MLKRTHLDKEFIQVANRKDALSKPFLEKTRLAATGKDDLTAMQQTEERRKYRRIEHQQITDEEITIYCKNTVTGKHHFAEILNISPGGLLMTSRSRLTLGDELLLEGRLGRYFKFKEHAISRSCDQEHYGLEFINLSMETTHFLNRLTGTVDTTKANRLLTDQPN